MTRLNRYVITWGVLGLAVAVTAKATAAEGGLSDYVSGLYGDFDSAAVPGPGFYVGNDLFYNWGSLGESTRQGRLSLDVDTDAVINLVKLVVFPNFDLGNLHIGAGVFVPFGWAHAEGTVSVLGRNASQSQGKFGLADLYVNPVMLHWSNQAVHLLTWAGVVVPVGAYDVDDFVNIGRNYWALDPNFAVTWLAPANLILSGNIGMFFNAENPATDYDTGNELHIDATVGAQIKRVVGLGVSGFVYNQVSDDSGSGATLGGFQSSAVGLGPVANWTTPVGVVTAKWIHQFDTERRMGGDYVFLRFATALWMAKPPAAATSAH